MQHAKRRNQTYEPAVLGRRILTCRVASKKLMVFFSWFVFVWNNQIKQNKNFKWENKKTGLLLLAPCILKQVAAVSHRKPAIVLGAVAATCEPHDVVILQEGFRNNSLTWQTARRSKRNNMFSVMFWSSVSEGTRQTASCRAHRPWPCRMLVMSKKTCSAAGRFLRKKALVRASAGLATTWQFDLSCLKAHGRLRSLHCSRLLSFQSSWNRTQAQPCTC